MIGPMKTPEKTWKTANANHEEQREKWRIATAKYRATPKGAKSILCVQNRFRRQRISAAQNHFLERRETQGVGEEFRKMERTRQNEHYAADPEFRRRRSDYQRLRKTGMTPEMVNTALERRESLRYMPPRVLRDPALLRRSLPPIR